MLKLHSLHITLSPLIFFSILFPFLFLSILSYFLSFSSWGMPPAIDASPNCRGVRGISSEGADILPDYFPGVKCTLHPFPHLLRHFLIVSSDHKFSHLNNDMKFHWDWKNGPCPEMGTFIENARLKWTSVRFEEKVDINLTGGNWQKWKRVFMTCPCHEIYRDEAVGLKSCKNTWKITIFVKMWNLGQYPENLIFCQ